MKCAFIFAGQGGQVPGMGKELYDNYPVFKSALEQMDPTGKWRELCFEGTAEQLADTRKTQPCMVAIDSATTALLKAEGMTAVLGLSEELIQQACEQAKDVGYVAITNYNTPDQIVISGEKAAVNKASEVAKELGAKRCMPLAVSGPFHTKFMKPAGDALKQRFETIEFAPLQIPVLFNTTARPLAEGVTIAQMLVQQVQNPIHFDSCVEYMKQCGITCTIEVGVGKSLSKMVKKIDKEITTLQVFDCASLEETKQAQGL